MSAGEGGPGPSGSPTTAEIAGIVAVARNGVIGADGDMPWRLKGDLPRLKRLTIGDVLVMGRRTWDSLPGALPGRTSIVITRSPDWSAPGAAVAHSLDEALDLAGELAPGRTIWIFGGGEIYRMAWHLISRWEVTEVHAEPAGDTTFPGLSTDEWVEIYREPQDGFDWVGYRRRTEG
ncbi:dihydrofolate reductase [Enemella sp. A6]|uniref:dihydrofolate reductase n=1 Tax=Enemella sp. A6 TaxID=3440152 RepID=UPI003EBDECF3